MGVKNPLDAIEEIDREKETRKTGMIKRDKATESRTAGRASSCRAGMATTPEEPLI